MKSQNIFSLRRWAHKLLLSAALVLSTSAMAADPINTTFFGKLAVEGYDTVAYFTENQAIEGDKKFEHEWMNAKWRFSSAENLEAFKADPEAYAPQYGGYCAWAVSQNKIAEIDPTQFTVHEGKLYLNYNKKIQKRWLGDRDNFIAAADQNWPSVLN